MKKKNILFTMIGLNVYLLLGCSSSSEINKIDKELSDLKAKYQIVIESENQSKKDNVLNNPFITEEGVNSTDVGENNIVENITLGYVGNIVKKLENKEKEGYLVEGSILGIYSVKNDGFGFKIKDSKYEDNKITIEIESEKENNILNSINLKPSDFIVVSVDENIEITKDTDIIIFIDGNKIKELK